MTTGASILATCPSRTAIAGNPSDGYGGAVLSTPIDDLVASAAGAAAETFEIDAADPELRRLLDATARDFAAAGHALPDVVLSASTTIPRSVGLAGSSALIVAALRVLSSAAGAELSAADIAAAAHRVERERLGIVGGRQDPIVQTAGRSVLMDFDPPDRPPTVTPVDIGADIALFVAWDEAYTESSDIAHTILRRRASDPSNAPLVGELARQAHAAAGAVRARDVDALGVAIDRTFDLRCELTEIDPRQIRLVELGREAGAATNSAGSGGSVVGLAPSAIDLPRLRSTFESAGCEFLEIY